MSKRRMVRSPIVEIAPSFCLPPVDFCRGVSPSQAAKSRPARKPSGAGTRAVIAVAAIGPMPGIVISRRATGSAFARWVISASNAWICASKAWKVPINTFQDGSSAFRYGGARILDMGDHGIGVRDALGKNVAVLGQVPAQGVDALRALAHQEIAGAEHDPIRLLLLGFHRHKAHARALGGFADRLGIRPVVLVP